MSLFVEISRQAIPLKMIQADEVEFWKGFQAVEMEAILL